METLMAVLLAILLLALVTILFLLFRRPANQSLDTNNIIENLNAQFGKLSLEALGKAQTSFLELAESRFKTLNVAGTAELDQKKVLIDQHLGEMKAELSKVSNLVKELEKDREKKFGELTSQLKSLGEQSVTLATTTGALREALASARTRGQWGERMAEDVLRLIGFREGVNFMKQKTIDGNGSRPDFTFLLPHNLKLNMDVKFPLDNYLKFIDAKTDPEKEQCCNAFLRDARNRFKEVTTRDYIDPQQNTLDCVLVFIANEQVYHFIQERDGSILDEALKSRVVLCSPATLFAILVVVRQAIDNFTIERTANQIISELGAFKKQWDLFLDALQTVGKRIDAVQKEYELLVNRRRRALDRPLNRIEAIRKEHGLGLPDDVEYTEGELTLEEPEAK